MADAAFPVGSDGKPHLNKDLIGRDAAVLAKAAGFAVPAGTQVLYGETGEDHPFVQTEQMMPCLPFVRVTDVDRAIALAKSSEHGYGHTAILHSRDTDVMSRMGKQMECTIFVVNGPSTDGLGLGGAGQASFSIAGPTGEGITVPRTFTRRRRSTIVSAMRFI
jgi:aldehyde dehydrogenase